jgi:hypothetical protein
MINWYGIFSSALWVLGLAILLASLSWSVYQAAHSNSSWRHLMVRASYMQATATGMTLLTLGLGFLQGSTLWQSMLWFILAAGFATIAWQAHQQPSERSAQPWVHRHSTALGLILLGMMVASLYAFTIRPWMQPDEPRHYEVILHDARLGKPGTTDKDVNMAWEREIIADMETQSFWWYGYSLVGWDPNKLPDSFDTIWDPIYSRAFYQLPLYYDLAGLGLYTWGQTLSHAQAVLLLRFFGIFWLGISLGGIYALGRLLFPQRPQIALMALAFAALWPAHLAANAAVNNDPMAEALVIWATYFALRLLRDGPALKSLTWFFLFIILTIYTKRTGFSVLVLMLAIPGWGILHMARNASRRARMLGIATLAAGIIAIPLGLYLIKATGRYWLTPSQQANLSPARLWQLVLAAPLTKSSLAIYRTFWGWFGWLRVPLPSGLYWAGSIITVGMLLLLGLGYWQVLDKKRPAWQKMGLILLLLTLLTQIGLTLGKDIVYQAWKAGSVPQMRYLYPVLPAMLLPMAAGLQRIAPKAGQTRMLTIALLVLLCFNFYILAFILYPFFWL